MATTLYGMPQSRALRSIWAIEEVGIDYDHVPTHFATDTKKPDYLAINPNGRIPALVDGDVTLFESMAINLYLARTYGGDLYPSDPADEARAIQWSIWGMTEIEPPLMQMVLNKFMLPEDQRDPEAVKTAETAIEKPLAVLDAALDPGPCLLGDRFTVSVDESLMLNLLIYLETSSDELVAFFLKYDFFCHSYFRAFSRVS